MMKKRRKFILKLRELQSVGDVGGGGLSTLRFYGDFLSAHKQRSSVTRLTAATCSARQQLRSHFRSA